MLSAASASNESGKAPTKRSLFAKPSWSKTQDLGTSDLFHRSDKTYVASTAQAERKRQERLARREKERVPFDEEGGRASKRQRLSEDEEDNDDDDEEESDTEGAENQGSDSDRGIKCVPAEDNTKSPVKRSVGRSVAVPGLSKPISSLVDEYHRKTAEHINELEEPRSKISNVISLDQEEEESSDPTELSQLKVVSSQKSIQPDVEEVIVSDEEFPELARKAREKARRKRLEQDMASLTPELPSFTETDTHYKSPPIIPPPSTDSILQILITSDIPNTTPLIVSRKLGQRLKDVRLAWISRQLLSSDAKDGIFLTWRLKRLFDVTTCRSLGVTVEPDGRVMVKGDLLGDDEGRIHMEAMNIDLLEARRRAKIQEATPSDSKEAEQQTQGPFEDKVDNQVRIILKAKGYGEFKLRVKPVSFLPGSQMLYQEGGLANLDHSQTTLISKMVNAFRHTNKLDLDKEVYIMFEGERLNPSTTVEDAEIADMDSLDTYVK